MQTKMVVNFQKEHILYNGNEQVILCERGLKSFDNAFTRNLMDISAVPVIKKLSHLPIIVDPSHGTGQRYLIEPMAKAGLVVGADGVESDIPINLNGEEALKLKESDDSLKKIVETIEL